ncbi:MAG: hypothetical protein EU532_05675 [Promethearchaeota archaeon]|nr:MAG: hypothetical protein EU532_05675 [Candidatus Lokiarchaeota archaeon]
MAEITKEDLYLKARLLAEGLHFRDPIEKLNPELQIMAQRFPTSDTSTIEVPDKIDFNNLNQILELKIKTTLPSIAKTEIGTVLILDKSKIKVPIYPNRHSRLEFSMNGDGGKIYDRDDLVATGKFLKKPKWMDEKLSNGLPIEYALPAPSEETINMNLTLSCCNYNANQGCRYCAHYNNPISRKINILPIEVLREYNKIQSEAVKIATDHGWRGNIAVSGGGFAPAQRSEQLARIKLVVNGLHESLGDEVFKELGIVINHYPPEDLSDLNEWKELGVMGSTFDLEVLDEAYFSAICPGKSTYKPFSYWKKAQEVAVEVFGPLFGSTGCIVVGIEPMSTLLAGFEERLSKGVMLLPIVFMSCLGSAYWGFRTPTADWIVEASNKIVDIFLKHGIKWLRKASKFAKREGAQKAIVSGIPKSGRADIVFDELGRRITEKFGGKSLAEL